MIVSLLFNWVVSRAQQPQPEIKALNFRTSLRRRGCLGPGVLALATVTWMCWEMPAPRTPDMLWTRRSQAVSALNLRQFLFFFSRFCMPWFLTLFASKTPMRLQQAASVISPPFTACLGATSMSCPRASAAKHTTVTVHLRDDYCNRKAWTLELSAKDLDISWSILIQFQ